MRACVFVHAGASARVAPITASLLNSLRTTVQEITAAEGPHEADVGQHICTHTHVQKQCSRFTAVLMFQTLEFRVALSDTVVRVMNNRMIETAVSVASHTLLVAVAQVCIASQSVQLLSIAR